MDHAAQRLVAVLALLAGVGLLASLPGAGSGYLRALNAAQWHSTMGHVTERTNETLPSFACFVRDTRYTLIEYRFVASDGRMYAGSAQAPLRPDLYGGATVEVRFNPRKPSDSLPQVSIAGYRAAQGGTLLLAFPLALGFLYTSRRLWRRERRRQAAVPVATTDGLGARD